LKDYEVKKVGEIAVIKESIEKQQGLKIKMNPFFFDLV
jgi:hypothetical protein